MTSDNTPESRAYQATEQLHTEAIHEKQEACMALQRAIMRGAPWSETSTLREAYEKAAAHEAFYHAALMFRAQELVVA